MGTLKRAVYIVNCGGEYCEDVRDAQGRTAVAAVYAGVASL